MASFIALLRAINVGGTGKLPMSDLKALCKELGFTEVRTYIASGNVVFASRKSEAAVKAALEKRLAAYAGKEVGVLVRSAAEMAQVSADNPFPKVDPSRTMAIFLDDPPPKEALAAVRGRKDEEVERRYVEEPVRLAGTSPACSRDRRRCARMARPSLSA